MIVLHALNILKLPLDILNTSFNMVFTHTFIITRGSIKLFEATSILPPSKSAKTFSKILSFYCFVGLKSWVPHRPAMIPRRGTQLFGTCCRNPTVSWVAVTVLWVTQRTLQDKFWHFFGHADRGNLIKGQLIPI